MGRPKQQAFRDLVIEQHKNGKANNEIFQMICWNVSEWTVSRWIKNFKDNGEIASKISTGRPQSAVTQKNKR